MEGIGGQKSLSGEGGVGLLVRKSAGEVKIAKRSKVWDIIWIELTREEEKFYIASAYISPVDSKREIDVADFIQELEVDIQNFQTLGRVIVMGDFNSRIGDEPSKIYIEDKEKIFMRQSVDKVKKVSRKAKR